MHRRYNRWWARFEQPDPYDGSYDMADPQSFNRNSYVQNDPVNFVDPTGLVTYDGALYPHLIADGLVGGLTWAIQRGSVIALDRGFLGADELHAYWLFSLFTPKLEPHEKPQLEGNLSRELPMQMSIFFVVVVSLLSISCANQLKGERNTNLKFSTNASVTPSVKRTVGEWRKVEVPLDRPADVITFGDQGQIAIVGQGILLLSLDSGQTWRSVSGGNGSNMYTTDGKKFQNESIGRSISIDKLCSVETAVFSSSGQLYLDTTCDHSSALWSVPTGNVADTWYVRSFAPSAEPFDNDIEYSSPGRNLVATRRRVLVDGKLSNETVLLTTEDQGATWRPMWRDGRATRIVGLDFLDEQSGWMLQADGKVLRTNDGGSTWVQNSTLPANAVGRVVSLDFVNANVGFIVGEEELILATNDGGKTWKQQISGTQMSLSRVAAVDENKAWVVGEKGTVLETDNGGTSWVKHPLGIEEDIQTLTVNNGVAWLVVSRSVYRSN